MHDGANKLADCTVLTGSNLDHLPAFADHTFDSCVTDPPYELGFMGKAWDKSGIAYSVDLWREVYRVLKPGAYLLAFGGSRTYHRLACAIEDAGFEIRDQIQWIYGQGFPKSLDLNKAFCLCNIDTDRAKPYDHQIQARLAESGESPEYGLRPLFDTDLSPQIPTGSASGQVLQSILSEQNTQRTVLWAESEKGISTGEKSGVERRRDTVQNEGQLQRRNLSAGSRMGEADGSERRLHNGASLDNGSNVRTPVDADGSSQPQRSSAEQQPTNQPRIISNQRRPQAGRINEICSGCSKPFLPEGFDRSKIEGFGTALKPSHEPICMARKPLEKGLTVAQNVLKWGTGAINVDGCRIETTGGDYNHPGNNGIQDNTKVYGSFANKNQSVPCQLGRFPANVIHDGSDEVLEAFPHTASGQPCGIKAGGQGNVFGEFAGGIAVTGFGDEGSAARFFYSPKASKYDRNAGLDGVKFDGLELIVCYTCNRELQVCQEKNITNLEESVRHQKDTGVCHLKAICECGIEAKSDTALSTFLFGSESMAKFQKAIKSTIATKTNSITTSPILNLKPPFLTNESTAVANLLKVNGINPAENAEIVSTLTTFINDLTAFLHDASDALSRVQLKINVKENSSDHPTVKPTDLMQYLCRLVTPPGGLILEPFLGSGSTAKAALIERFRVVGIELNAEYAKIAEARCKQLQVKLF